MVFGCSYRCVTSMGRSYRADHHRRRERDDVYKGVPLGRTNSIVISAAWHVRHQDREDDEQKSTATCRADR
jgi:hypothetical protein